MRVTPDDKMSWRICAVQIGLLVTIALTGGSAVAQSSACAAERQTLIHAASKGIPSPYALDALSGVEAGWLERNATAMGTLLPSEGLATFRDRYIKCVLNAPTPPGVAALEDSGRRIAQAKAQQYTQLVSVTSASINRFTAPPLISVVLNAAAEDAAKRLDGLPQKVAQEAIARTINTRGSFDVQQVAAQINAVAASLDTPEEARTFLRRAAENYLRDQLKRRGGNATELAFALMGASNQQELVQRAGNYALGQLPALIQDKGTRDAVNNVVTFVAAARQVTDLYNQGLITYRHQLGNLPKEAVSPHLAQAKNEVTRLLGGDASLRNLRDLETKARTSVVVLSAAAQKDLASRIGAAEVQASFAQATTQLNTLAGAVALVNKDAARYVSAAGTVTSTVSTLAGMIAQGTMGPVGWVSMGLTVVQAGGSIGALFGGGGGGGGAEQAMMEELREIKKQLKMMEALMREQHRETMVVLTEQRDITDELLRLELAAMWKAYQPCSSVANSFERLNSPTPRHFALDLTLQHPDVRSAIRSCHEFLFSDSPAEDAGGGGLSKLRSAFHQSTSTYDRYLEAKKASPGSSDLFGGYWRQMHTSQLNDVAYRRLAKAAEARYKQTPQYIWSLPLESHHSWRSIEARLQKRPSPPPASNESQNSALTTIALQVGVGALERDASLHNLVPAPLAPEPILTVLSVASRLANVTEYLTFESSTSAAASTATVQSDRQLGALTTEELHERRLRGDTWLSKQGPLALAAAGWVVMQRGDYVVPLASELLDWADRTHRCTNDKDMVDALCTQLGGSAATEEYVRMARRLVREVPEFRANVAAWRVRQALGTGVGKEWADGTRDASDYDKVLRQPAESVAEQARHPIHALLPGRMLFKMNHMTPMVPLADRPNASGSHWYMRISGNCLRFQELLTLADNAKKNCSNGKCVPATNIVPVLPKELDKWDTEKASACVVAPLPLATTVQEGRPRTSVQLEVLLDASNTYLQQLAYYTRLSELSTGSSAAMPNARKPTDGVRAVEMATFVRPPEVAPWRWAFPRTPAEAEAAAPEVSP